MALFLSENDVKAVLTAEMALAGVTSVGEFHYLHHGAGGVPYEDANAMGAALVAGAAENLTPVIHRIPPFAAGHPRRIGRAGPHGAKWVIGSRYLQGLVLRKKAFPRRLLVQVLRIGPSVLVGLPFEIVGNGHDTANAALRVDVDVGEPPNLPGPDH